MKSSNSHESNFFDILIFKGTGHVLKKFKISEKISFFVRQGFRVIARKKVFFLI
jgi:hypothetical protein